MVFCTHIYDNFVGFLVSVNRSGKEILFGTIVVGVSVCYLIRIFIFVLSHIACLSLIFHVIPTHFFLKIRAKSSKSFLILFFCFLLTFLFLDASSHLYKRVCPSVGRSIGPSVRPSVRPSVGLPFFLDRGN